VEISQKEIAKMTGVSVTTVSNVCNNKIKGKMSKKTYEKIKKIIDITDYSPNPIASTLRSGLSKVIAIILPSTTNPYYTQLSYFIENEAYKHELLTFVCNSNSNIDREKKYLNILKNHKVRGILLCSTELINYEIKNILDLSERTNIILLDEEIDNFKGHVIVGDDYLGGYKAAKYLHNLGHKNILTITGPKKLISTNKRLKGFIDYLSITDKKINKELLFEGNFDIESGYDCVYRAIKKNLKFTAVFAFNDLMAIGAIQSLFDNKIKIPSEVSILGYDDIFVDKYFTPKITTIAPPLDEIAKKAVNILIKNINNGVKKSAQKPFLVEPVLIERESCKKII